jgi:DNA (cytosine-5)-methyltransferase 1
MEKKLTIAGLFAGVGGIERGFKGAGFTPVLSNEIDKSASITFRSNNSHLLIEGDIHDLSHKEFPQGLTVLAGGFPCQPFSVAGYRKGFQDDRGNVFWQIHRIYNKVKPEVVFLENVKNLKNHDNGKTYNVIEEALRDSGYHVRSSVLNAKDYSQVPQNRERIYILAFKSKVAAENFEFPKKLEKSSSIEGFLDFDTRVDEKFYYTSKTPFYSELKKQVTEVGRIYQWRRQYVRENKSGVSPTLTANMGMGGHNVPIILTTHGIRKLTPNECFRLMGFEKFNLPEGMTQSQLYKQAGNSVVVPVIKRLAQQIKKVI